MRLAALVLALACATAHAQVGPLIVKQDGSNVGPAPFLDFPSSDFSVSCSSGTCTPSLAADATLLGMTIGDAGSELPAGTSPPTTSDAGQLYIETDVPLDPLLVSPSTNLMVSVGARYLRLGGDGADGDFTWNGTTGCSQGTISSTTCILPANSLLGRYSQDAGSTLYSCDYHFDDFTLSGGTVTCFQSGAISATTTPPQFGSQLMIRVAGALSLTGGTVDMAGKGALAGTGASTAGSGTARNGGSGGGTAFFPPSTGGIGASSTAAVAGIQPPATLRVFPIMSEALGWGAGGGGAANAGANGSGGFSTGSSLGMFWPSIGSTGGGGGYCTSSATTGGTGGAGGRGGGGIRFEYAGTYACTGATFTTAASNGANVVSGQAGGGGGGGAGAIETIARAYGTDTCTYTVSGGSGGSAGTNCSAGATGGNNRRYSYTVPQ